jgi:dihydroorotase
MKIDLLIKGGRVIDPGQKIDEVCDLVISQGKLTRIGAKGVVSSKNLHIINASGFIVCPGFIDLHCHLREPGFEDKETIATGTRAAAAGGFTTICCMPNTNPPLDNVPAIDYVNKIASTDGVIRVLSIGCITKGRQGKELTEMYELAEAGVIGFSDDGDPVASSRLMYLAMEYSRSLNLPIIAHCEDKDLANGGFMNEGWVSTYLGLKGVSAASEEIMIARDISLAKLTGARLHIAHVSTEVSVDLIRNAKKNGVDITAEVTPHHLTLTEENIMGMLSNENKRLKYDTNAKVNPPLRTRKDIDSLIEGLKDGTIDTISTDHAPHATEDKMCEFGLAAYGISGLETALGCLMTLVHSGQLNMITLISKLTSEPARIIGTRYENLGAFKTNCQADIAIIDPNKEWMVNRHEFISKGKNTPFDGHTFRGKVMVTISAGNIVYQDKSMKAIG